MATTIVGLFDEVTQADRAVRVLVGSGFGSEDISLLTHNSNGEAGSAGGVKRNEPVAGAGSILSDYGNIILGRLTLVIPAIGLLVAAGPLATTLARTTLGTPACGLLEALSAIGISEEYVGYYTEGVRRGGTFVAVRTADRLADRAEDILKIHKAVDMRKRVARWRNSGWVNFTPKEKPFSLEETTQERAVTDTEHKRASDFNLYDTDFRSHFFIMTEETREASYEQYAPAYRYGYRLAHDPRYSDRAWSIVEADIRRDWEKQNQGTWEKFADALSYGFLKAREHRLPRAA